MIYIWLFSTLALAFSSAPSRACKEDFECVLVRETYCGSIQAISLGLDEEWAKWDQAEKERRASKKEVCEPGNKPLPQPHQFNARCVNGQCVAERKTP